MTGFTEQELRAMAEYDARVEEEPLTPEEITASRERDLEALGKSIAETRKKAARQRRYYESHREQIMAYHKAYREAHKDELNAKRRAYYAANKERILAQQKIYKAANRERVRGTHLEYYHAHKDEINAKRRAKREAERATDV